MTVTDPRPGGTAPEATKKTPSLSKPGISGTLREAVGSLGEIGKFFRQRHQELPRLP